jgi:hypothetical protein
MAIRDTLITGLTANLASSNVSVSSELPFNSGGEPLYIKNKKFVYVDQDNIDVTELYGTLDGNDIYETETTVTAYLTVDAKNQPADIDTIVNTVIAERLGVSEPHTKECVVDTEITLDYITYNFDYRFITV